MAQPPSPSASSTLLPFLGGRSRRGSLASITSTKGGFDKDVLSQALDNIHTSASKSETFTSFHDFDGGPTPRNRPKELVSSGVTGLYDKFMRGLSIGTPVREAKNRPKSSGSRETVETESVLSGASRKAPTLSLKSPTADNASIVSNTSITASPVLASFTTNTTQAEVDSKEPQSDAQRKLRELGKDDSYLRADTKITGEESHPERREHQNGLDHPSHQDLDRARSAIIDNDHSDEATRALARVLSHHEVQGADQPKQRFGGQVGDSNVRSVNDPEHTHHLSWSVSTQPPHGIGDAQTFSVPASAERGHASQGSSLRPSMNHIGASHLPGFEASRGSSSDGRDEISRNNSQTSIRRPALDEPLNLNTALGRKRTGYKAQATSAQSRSVDYVPSHLKRRVISKAFWMKDENARDCFYCGQNFSTFRRKHHCRTCGQIFDAQCTTLVSGRPFGQAGTIRLCKPCEAMICGSDDDSTVVSDDGSEYPRSPLRRRDTGDSEDVAGGMDGISDHDGNAAEVTTPSIGIPASRRNREAKRRSAVIEFDAAPMLARPTSSHSLISLARRPRSSSHRRHHSRQQTMRSLKVPAEERVPFHPASVNGPEKKHALPVFHNDNIIDPDLAAFASDDGSDDDDQPSIFTAMGEVNNASPGERERFGFGGLLASAARKSRSRLGPTAIGRAVKDDDTSGQGTRHWPKLNRNRNPSVGTMSFSRPSPRRSRSNLYLEPSLESAHLDGNPEPTFAALHTTRTKLVRSSAMRGPHAPAVELNSASLEHVRKMLVQSLADGNIASAAAWEKALVPILLQCTDDVEPNVQQGDDMDIRHYVKLKKVPGGRPGDTSYVSGVVFSKNIALKSMARSIAYPRIAIVTFAIEYARHQTHFMSLEPVIAQEQEYLHNLVGRITALRPRVLLVQRHVSGLALDLLEKAGITVVSNIKESVLAAVARVTATTMIKSVDKLAMDPSHLGQCESFEVKTYAHEGVRKTYVFLSGCQPDLGCTIVLRGADTKTLRKIKRITEFMCYVAYNLKLETSLLRDEFVSAPSTAGQQIEAPEPLAGQTGDPESQAKPLRHRHGDLRGPIVRADHDDEMPYKYEQMWQESRTRLLSVSPFVVFMQPHMLTQLRESEIRLRTYKRLRDQYAAADEAGDEDEKGGEVQFEMVKPEMVHAPASKDQPKALREYLHAVHEAQLEKTTHTYETQRRLMDSLMTGDFHPFDPFAHQTIIVLHSTVSTFNSAPCIGPELLGIGFYAGYSRVEPQFEEDCTLGQYIEDLCISSTNTCKECGKKMSEHHRQYVHGYGQLSLSVSRQPAKMRGYQKTILMWASCRICKQETTVIPMSDITWKYSFAKYLELSFWSSPLHPRAGVCQHDVHKDFLRCFGFEDLVMRVQYDAVDIYDVVVPRSTITWKVEADLTVKNDQFTHFVARLNAFTDSIRKRLDSINVDTLDEKKAIEAHELLHELRQRAANDHNELLEKLQKKYATSRYYELIPLNRALRFMDEKALAWDGVFNDFERDYFPSETDIRKLATLQLRNMFLESQPPTSAVVSDASDDEDGNGPLTAAPKYLKERLTAKEMQSEKAQDVLSSTVEEHRGSVADIDDVVAAVEKTEEPLGSSLSKKISPREEQEQAVQRDDVKHLDLAVASKSPEDNVVDGESGADEQYKQASRPTTRDGRSSDEPFATQTKPMSAGLLERIEQIRSTKIGAANDTEVPESKIPRLADLRKRDTSPAPNAPPLLRAQSSPSSPKHVARRSADLNSEHSIDAVATGTLEHEAHHGDMRLGERLGVGRLASKVGKVAPSLIPRSVPKTEEPHHPKVSALAKHFEQMSREFEKERLKERRQRALRSRQARANPLASSRPVVEVYRNATDAVGERAVDQVPPSEQVEQTHDSQTASDTAHQTQLASSDETSPDHGSDQQLHITPSRRDHNHVTDPDVEGELSDVEAPKLRSRDFSDPTSGVSTSAGLLSPGPVPDVELHPELSITEQKKSVWFKYLADFWSKRSASGWANLEYPLHATEHVFEDSDIIVRDDEPSSVIALSLACADYQAKVQEFRSHPKKHTKQHAQNNSQASNSFEAEETQQKAIEASLLSDTGTHMKYSFAHGHVKATCKIFYAESFDALRRRCGVADRFVESLSRCLKFDSKGGKTKSLFLKTLDNRFVIKSLQEVELKAFTKFAPDYFAFMSHTLFHGVPSVIAKMFGLFQVIIKNPATGADFSYYLLVMENLFYERNPNRRFDLKGSMRNRKIESTGQPDEVLLDENLVETIFESPLFVREHARKLLQASVWNDTLWLCKQNVMDYSLMAGFDDERKELVVGIIDCIRTYTWDKKLESWIKDRGKNKPTITSPKDYRNRFRVSMMQYVLQAPNCWHQLQAQMAAPKTLKERDDAPDGTETDREGEGRRSEGV